MKTRNVVLTVAMVVMSFTLALANDPTSKLVVLSSADSEIFKVIYQGNTEGQVMLQVADRQGNIILTETTNGIQRFMRPVNFSGMPYGMYAITVKDASGVQTQYISYQANAGIEKVTASEFAAQIHIARLKDGKYLFTAASKTKGTINVTILDENNNVLQENKFTVANALALVYNFKSVEGRPVFRIQDEAGNTIVK